MKLVAEWVTYQVLRGVFVALGWLFLAVVDPAANQPRHVKERHL